MQASGDGLGEPGILPLEFLFDWNQIQVQRYQDLPGRIVQFARDAASFIILHPQQLCRKRSQAFLGALQFRGAVLYHPV